MEFDQQKPGELAYSDRHREMLQRIEQRFHQLDEQLGILESRLPSEGLLPEDVPLTDVELPRKPR